MGKAQRVIRYLVKFQVRRKWNRTTTWGVLGKDHEDRWWVVLNITSEIKRPWKIRQKKWFSTFSPKPSLLWAKRRMIWKREFSTHRKYTRIRKSKLWTRFISITFWIRIASTATERRRKGKDRTTQWLTSRISDRSEISPAHPSDLWRARRRWKSIPQMLRRYLEMARVCAFRMKERIKRRSRRYRIMLEK